MTEAEVIVIVRQHLEGKFPKMCSHCGRTYANLKDYVMHTTHLGKPRSYDVELGDYRPAKPIGTMALANCSCGNTLVVDSVGMDLATLWRLMAWLVGEVTRHGRDSSEVLATLRASVERAALADHPSS